MFKMTFFTTVFIAGTMASSINAMEEADMMEPRGMTVRCPSLVEVQNAMNSNQDTVDVDGIRLHITFNHHAVPGVPVVFKYADLGIESNVLTCRYNVATISSAKMKQFNYVDGGVVEAPGRRLRNIFPFYLAQNNDPENLQFFFVAEDDV